MAAKFAAWKYPIILSTCSMLVEALSVLYHVERDDELSDDDAASSNGSEAADNAERAEAEAAEWEEEEEASLSESDVESLAVGRQLRRRRGG